MFAFRTALLSRFHFFTFVQVSNVPAVGQGDYPSTLGEPARLVALPLVQNLKQDGLNLLCL